MAQILWTRNFLTAQGMYVPTTTIYQDNKITILLDENGKSSSSRHTQHSDIRYFFVTDKIKKGDVKVAFCPTHDVLGDFFTKPLQGSLFIRMREKLLNLPSSASAAVHRSVLENNEKIWEKTRKTKDNSSENTANQNKTCVHGNTNKLIGKSIEKSAESTTMSQHSH